MNKYDLQLKTNREIKENFLSGKTQKEIDTIQPIKEKFLNDRKGITKEEYNELIKYYFNSNMINHLKYDNYKYAHYLHMEQLEQQIYKLVLKHCLMI